MWNVSKKEVYDIFKRDFSIKYSCIITMTYVIDRSSIKYGKRAYTFSHIEAGYIGQNICLISELMGSYKTIQKELLRILDFHNNKELILYPIAIA